jgi:hypothetical protein
VCAPFTVLPSPWHSLRKWTYRAVTGWTVMDVVLVVVSTVVILPAKWENSKHRNWGSHL